MLEKIKLPVWEGTYKKANEGKVKEFSLKYNYELNILQQTNIVKTNYESSKYSFITKPPGNSEYSNSIGKVYINKITNLIKEKSLKNILEIGAGSNFIAKGIYEKNPYALATLIDPTLNLDSSKKIKIIKSYFPSLKIKNKKFDFIYSINTLEHVENPDKFLLEVRNSITNEGLIIFIFPDIENQFKRGDIGSLLHEHLNYFTLKSAKYLFENCGLEIIESSSENDEITLLCKKKEINQKNSNFAAKEEIKDLSNNVSLMTEKIYLNKKKILELHSKGMKIGFHGACNALSNFLYLSDLNEIQDFLIFDGDDTKVNTFLPLCQNKIIHSSSKYYKEMDYLFIAASTFSNEITSYAKELIKSENIIDLFS